MLPSSASVSKQVPAVLSQRFPQRSTNLPREDCCTGWKYLRHLCHTCHRSDNPSPVQRSRPDAQSTNCPESPSRCGNHPHAPTCDVSCTTASGYGVTSRRSSTSARHGGSAGSDDCGNPETGKSYCHEHERHARWPWESCVTYDRCSVAHLSQSRSAPPHDCHNTVVLPIRWAKQNDLSFPAVPIDRRGWLPGSCHWSVYCSLCQTVSRDHVYKSIGLSGGP